MTLAEKLTEAEKSWQNAIAQAAYWQGRVDLLRELAKGDAIPAPVNGEILSGS